MKLALFLSLSLFLSFNWDLKADEIQIPNSVVINQPSHMGVYFLALTSNHTDPHVGLSDDFRRGLINEKAAKICKKMGYGKPTGSTLSYSKSAMQLADIDNNGNISTESIYPFWEPPYEKNYENFRFYSELAYFRSISCTILAKVKNKDEEENKELIKKLLLEIELLKNQVNNSDKQVNKQSRSGDKKETISVNKTKVTTKNTEQVK